MLPKRNKSQQDKLPATPLDAQQRKIEEQERAIREKMQRCEELIEKAPEIKKQQLQAQRDELINRAAQIDGRRASTTTLPDLRDGDEELNAMIARPDRPLRGERSQDRLIFILLLIALGGAMLWLYYTVTHST